MGDDYDAFGQSALLRASLRRALRDAGAVTGCSSMVLEDLQQRFGLMDGTIVPNGIRLDETSTQPAGPGWWPEHGPVVLSLGRIEHKKGFDLLLRAFARLVDLDVVPSTARLVIGGDGSSLGELRDLAEELGVADQVILPGRLGRDHVAAAIARAAVFVVPSRIEAFGIVALEAWRGGCPLIMTSRGGAKDFVTDSVDGLVVDPEDTAALGGAIASVLASPDRGRRLAEAASLRVRDFSWEHVSADYERLYDRVATDRTHP